MKKILLSFLAVASLSTVAQAQFSWGPELGVNLSNYIIEFPGFLTPTTVPVPGAHLGVLANYRFSDHLAIEPAAFFSINGIKYSESIFIATATFSAHLNTIRIPLNLQYTFGKPGGNRWFAGAGPFLGINLGGSAKASANIPAIAGISVFSIDTAGKITAGNDSSDYIKRFDFGVGINVGYQLTSGLFFRANYSRGLLNMTPVIGGETNSIHSVNYALSVGYLIGYNKKGKTTTTKTTTKSKSSSR